MICLWCTDAHGERCEEKPRAADRPDAIRHEHFDVASDDEPPIIDSSSDDDLESKVFWTNLGDDEGDPALIGGTMSRQMEAGWRCPDHAPPDMQRQHSNHQQQQQRQQQRQQQQHHTTDKS